MLIKLFNFEFAAKKCVKLGKAVEREWRAWSRDEEDELILLAEP